VPRTQTVLLSYGYEIVTHLFFKAPRPETAKYSVNTFRSSSQATTCYYQSNHSKLEAFPLSDLPKDKTSELTGLVTLHYLPFLCW